MPLYAVETVRALSDRGVLAEREDGLAAVAEIGELEVPPSLHSLLSARLDALAPDERELVRSMAVFGARFSRASAAALSGLSEDRLDEVLASLVGREILSIATGPLSPERGQYAFAQSMLRAVAYEMIGRRERKALHLAAAERLGASAPGEREEVAEVVSAHMLGAFRAAAGDPDEEELRGRAIATLRLAAQRAANVGAPEAAARSLLTAGEIAVDERERAELTAEAGWRNADAGNYGPALEQLERAAAEHAAAGRERDAARLAGSIGHVRGTARQGRLRDRADARRARGARRRRARPRRRGALVRPRPGAAVHRPGGGGGGRCSIARSARPRRSSFTTSPCARST